MSRRQLSEAEHFQPGRVSSTARSESIKCPYFKCHGAMEVRCCGITENTRIALRFMEPKSLREHERIFCADRYWCCEICEMLDKLDEEDE